MKQHLTHVIQKVKGDSHQLKWESVLTDLQTDALKTGRARDVMKAYHDINSGKRTFVSY